MAPRTRIVAQRVNHRGKLVYVAAIGCRPGAPLIPVHGTQIVVLIGPFIPNADLMPEEEVDIAVTGDKPQKFGDHRPEMHLLGRHHRQPLAEVEAHLATENADGARAGAIGLVDAVIEDVSHETEIGPHCFRLSTGPDTNGRHSPLCQNRAYGRFHPNGAGSATVRHRAMDSYRGVHGGHGSDQPAIERSGLRVSAYL